MLSPDAQDGKTFRAITFHDIRPNLKQSFATDPEDAAVDQRMLVEFLAWLGHNGYQPVSVQQIMDANTGSKSLPPKAVLLTFDDGYVSFYEKVFPLLKSYGYPAVLALVTSWMEVPANGQVQYGARLRPRSDFVTWAQAREMAQSGLVEIASHSHDLHHGLPANPQGNLLPAATSRRYDRHTRSYESPQAYAQRIVGDLRRSHALIRQKTGVSPRTVVWPYGEHNVVTQDAARRAGFSVMATLINGPNDAGKPLHAVRRAYATYSLDIGRYAELLRTPLASVDNLPPQRTMYVGLDMVYDPDPLQQERKLSSLIDCVHAVRPRSVVLQAYSDHQNDEGLALYFPNRHLPMRADLFSRVSWQLRTRAGVNVFARMPVLDLVPGGATQQPVDAFDGGGASALTLEPAARRRIREIYEDLGRSSRFAGILFDDATAGQSRMLIPFTQELAEMLRTWQPGLLSARTLDARALNDAGSGEVGLRDYADFLAAYDFTVVAAASPEALTTNPDAWLAGMAQRALALPGASHRIMFVLPTRNGHNGQPIADVTLERQVQLLRRAGMRNFGYFADDHVANLPDQAVARKLFSASSSLTDRARDEQAKARVSAMREQEAMVQ